MEKIEYDRMFAVEDSHFWYKGMRKITETLLHKFLKKKAGNVILDAGCGTGGSLLFLKHYGTTYGVDISIYAIGICKERGLDHVQVSGIEDLPFKDNFFDIITCFDVLPHQSVKNHHKALREFFRVLKPGGILIVRAAAYHWLFSYHDKQVQNKHRYTAFEINNLTKEAHFKILKTTYANTLLFPILLFLRYINNFFSSRKNGSDVRSVHPLINSILYTPFFIESFFIRYFNLPFGMSVISVARK